jgi:hypothetical protein
MPREQAPAQYQEQNERRYRNQVDEELQFKHDKRSNLVLGRGKSLVLSSSGGVQFALSLSDAGIIVVTDVATGDVTTVTLEWSALANRPTNLVALTGSEGIVTINNTAAGITGQGALATLSAVTWATQVTGVGRPEDYATYSRVYRQDSAPSSPNTNDIWVVTTGGGVTPIAVRAWNGSAWVTGADITLINTAAAITGQGPGATAAGSAVLNTFAYARDGADGSPIGDWNFTDTAYWGMPSGAGFAAGNPLPGTLRSIVLGNGTYDYYSEYWNVIPGEEYEITFRWWNGFPSFTGYIRPLLHIPAVVWLSARAVNAVDPAGGAGTQPGDITAGSSAGTDRFVYTIPSTVSQIQMRFIASIGGGVNFYYRLEMKPTRQVVRGADVTLVNTAAAIVGQGALATLNTIPAADKTVTKQNLDLDIDTSGTTWIVGPTFDMTVGATGLFSVPNSYIDAAVTAAISAGTNFAGNWRITEATQAAPATKTVLWSGTFVADSGGGSVLVSGYVSPRTLVANAYSGACRYTLEVQRASGTNNVTNLTGLLALTWTPQG